MPIPLKNRLKRLSQVRLAELQDEALEAVYAVFPDAVLHGGTAIWRCFQGNRFSEDLDFYAPVKKEFRPKLETELKKRGLLLTKFKQTENVVFAKISNNQVEMSIEISTRKSPEKVSVSFEKTDGSFTEIFSLSEPVFIAEKAAAYQSRRLIRDLYDVYFLLGKFGLDEKPRKELEKMLKNFQPPLDEKNLKTLVFSGAVPSSKSMLEKIRQRLSR
jgi:predicted nucleotidyltransferase component of viral defense system